MQTMPRGQKRKREESEDILTSIVDVKRRKLEEKKAEIDATKERFEENSDLSDIDEPLEYNIEDLLAPQEKELIRQDPLNLNFLATTWTNERTLIKERSEFKKWIGDWTHSGIFPTELFLSTIKFCDRIPDHEVDWFSEYRRNHINSLAIRRAFANISNNVQKIVKEYGVVKQGVKQPAIFERGVTDSEIDEHLAELDFYCPISNDLRELLKCCNGARFMVHNKDRIYDMEVFPAVFPTLEEISNRGSISYARFEKIELNGGYYSSDSEMSDEDIRKPLVSHFDPVIPDKPTRMEVTASDMESDGDDYEMSNQAASSEEEEVSSDESSEDSSGVFGVHKGMIGFTSTHVDDDDYGSEELYNINDGALYIADRSSSVVDFTGFPSIIAYLQDLNDLLDDTLAVFWLKLNDYELIKVTHFDELLDCFGETTNGLSYARWKEIVDRCALDVVIGVDFVPRAIKILIAATQDFAVKVFEHAIELTGDEELPSGTFTRSARELFPKELIPEYVPAKKGRPKKK